LLAINAPLISWCHNYVGNFTSNEPATGLSNVWNCGPACFDQFLMMHLYVGTMPTAPSPWGDHTNPTNPQTDSVYLDFAPLFETLQGKRWVLEPQVVTTNVTSVWANAFTNIRSEIVVPLSYQKVSRGGSPSPRRNCRAYGATNGTAIGKNNLKNLQLPLNTDYSACATACCSTQDCSGFTYQPTTIAHNGVCVEGPMPCCWLKSNFSAPIRLNASSLPGIVSGFVAVPPTPPGPGEPLVRGLFWLRFTYATPVLITKLRMEMRLDRGGSAAHSRGDPAAAFVI
jgi:hypothetical protein